MQRLALVTVVVPDYDEALAHYVGDLGFELVEDTTLSADKRWVVVHPPGDGCGLLLARATSEQQRARVGDQTGGRVAFFLDTDDLARDIERYRTAGVRFVDDDVRHEEYGDVIVFADRFGNRWDLVQRH